MFNNENDYLSATKNAQVNTKSRIEPSNFKLMLLNILLMTVLGAFAFFYFNSKENTLATLISGPKAVLGVSEMVDDADFSNQELMKILNATEVDSLTKTQKQYTQNELTTSMQLLVNESNIKSQSSYTDAIARELDDKSGFKGRIIVVKKGDTLSSLAEKFYGDSKEFSKIINNNLTLNNSSHLLIVGQTLNIPH